MSFRFAAVATLKNKRFWTWIIAGIIIYLIPATIRYATGSIIIPFLNWPGFWIDHFIPGNFSEKILVNMFFPGGAGAIAGEVFAGYYLKQLVTTKTKYLVRLAGAIVFVSAWSLFQLWGVLLVDLHVFFPRQQPVRKLLRFPNKLHNRRFLDIYTNNSLLRKVFNSKNIQKLTFYRITGCHRSIF